MVASLEFVLRGVNHELSCGGINTAIGIKKYIIRLSGTIFIHDANNNGWDASAVQGSRNNILTRGRGKGRRSKFLSCRGKQVDVTGSKECPYCMLFVVKIS